jgi:sulfonate transport system permease protein
MTSTTAAKSWPATNDATPVAATAPGVTPIRLTPPQPLFERSRPRWLSLSLRILVPLLILLAWALGSYSGAIAENVLAPPWVVLDSAWRLTVSGVLWHHLSLSLSRAGVGLLLGGGFGLCLGVVSGLSKVAEELIDPTVQMIRAVPFLALIPLLIVWFGIGESSKIILIAAGAAKPMYLNAFSGVRNVDPKIIEAAKIFGLSRWRMIVEIHFPAALPSLMVGLRLSMTMSLLALIGVEVINTTQGIGFLMLQAQEYFKTEILIVCVVIYALFGLSTDLLVRWLERVVMPWRAVAKK